MPPRIPIPRGSAGGGKPRLVLFVADRGPTEDRDLVLDSVDDVSHYGEDEEEKDDDDGDDDVAFDHFGREGGKREEVGRIDAVLEPVLKLDLELLL